MYTQVPFINMWWCKGLTSSALRPPESKENIDQIERETEGRGKREFLTSLLLILSFKTFILSLPSGISLHPSLALVTKQTFIFRLCGCWYSGFSTGVWGCHHDSPSWELQRDHQGVGSGSEGSCLCEPGTCMRSLGPCKRWKQNWLHKFVLWSLCV